jgi:hypothetical protein
VYCALRLNLPRRTTRRVPRRIRQPLAASPVLNQTWALDFMTETLYDGRRVRLLTMIDEGNREGLEIAVGLSLPSRRVIRVLDELVAVHGTRARIVPSIVSGPHSGRPSPPACLAVESFIASSSRTRRQAGAAREWNCAG